MNTVPLCFANERQAALGAILYDKMNTTRWYANHTPTGGIDHNINAIERHAYRQWP